MENRISIPINIEADIFIARQNSREIATNFGFGTIDVALIATAVSELTRNIITYAGKGKLTLELIEEQRRKGIRVVASDEGPGIENIELALQDGFSTSGSLGLGLPGVRRLMDDFEIHSKFGSGTSITAKKWLN
jgi:serine/threonine-protein kinase RsbT